MIFQNILVFICKYIVNMKNKKMYSIRIHTEQIDYLKNIASKNFTTVTQYILDLINKDMKNNYSKEL